MRSEPLDPDCCFEHKAVHVMLNVGLSNDIVHIDWIKSAKILGMEIRSHVWLLVKEGGNFYVAQVKHLLRACMNVSSIDDNDEDNPAMQESTYFISTQAYNLQRHGCREGFIAGLFQIETSILLENRITRMFAIGHVGISTLICTQMFKEKTHHFMLDV